MFNTSIIPSYVFDKSTGWREDLPSDIEHGTRVLCLYRVSTEKQLYHTENNEADIPMQRKRCRKFEEGMGWTIVCELQEEGVSGHKIRAENRDRIRQIKEYAKKKRFDILLVFMFDRIGRISDETPFVVEWFVRNGIRVWSTQEGEQRFENHTDKLTNYIRFWQADGESEKISMRTANSMALLTEDGCFTGGVCPYGYQLVRTGRTNKRRREVYDLAVCEEEAAIVRMIFQLAETEGYGAQRIANCLHEQGIKNRAGKSWHPATIQNMLKNILYTGILRSGSTRSPVQENLQIIDERTFGRVHEMLEARSRKNEAIRSKPLNTRGKSLLSGNVFCGHCGARLCVTTSGKGRKSADGTDTVRMRYTCQTKSRTHGDCDGQTGYTVEKLDGLLETIVKNIFSRVSSLSREEVVSARYNNDFSMKKSLLQKLKRDHEKAELDLQNLKNEIVKSISGESAFAPELLNKLITEKEQECDGLRKSCLSAEREIQNSEATVASMGRQYDDILEWCEAYENASFSARKMIVSNMVDRVDVWRGYQLHIKLNISVEQFLVGLDSLPDCAQDFRTPA